MDLILPPPLTGTALNTAVHEVVERTALIEGLIYEHTSLMICADAGIGKSSLLTQLAVQASAGCPVFGIFHVPRPLRIYYAIFERDFREPADRIRQMESACAINWDNLLIDPYCVGLTIRQDGDMRFLLKRLETIHPDIAIFDPIFGLMDTGVATEDGASLVAKFSTYLQLKLNISVAFGHHNVKNTQIEAGQGKYVRKANPFYGSQRIKAHVTGYYDLVETTLGTHWKCEKDTYGVLPEAFDLTFDEVTGLSHFDIQTGNLDKRERFRMFIRTCAQTGKTFTAKEALKITGMRDRYFRELIVNPEFKPLLRPISPNGKTTVYEVVQKVAS